MSKNKIFENPKNLAIATLVLAITMGSTIAFLHTFLRGSQFAKIEPPSTSVPPPVTTSEPSLTSKPPLTSAPSPVATPEPPSSELKTETTSKPPSSVPSSRRPRPSKPPSSVPSSRRPQPSEPPLTSAPSPVATPKPLTHSSHVDEVLNNLEWGNIAFNTPQKIRLEEPTIIELVLSPTQSIEELQSSLESQGTISSGKTRISNRMEADLVGGGFKIKPQREKRQAIASGETTRWKWEVTPTKSGSQNLELTLSVIINVSNENVPRVIQTFEKTIEVEVSVGQRVSTFVTGNWEWLWASILVPTAPFLWKLYQKK